MATIHRRDIAKALRDGLADADSIAERFRCGRASRNYILGELHHMKRDGLALRDGARWTLTSKGKEYAEARP